MAVKDVEGDSDLHCNSFICSPAVPPPAAILRSDLLSLSRAPSGREGGGSPRRWCGRPKSKGPGYAREAASRVNPPPPATASANINPVAVQLLPPPPLPVLPVVEGERNHHRLVVVANGESAAATAAAALLLPVPCVSEDPDIRGRAGGWRPRPCARPPPPTT